MRRLLLEEQGRTQPWAASSARYVEDDSFQGQSILVAVDLAFDMHTKVRALLDTGSSWTVISHRYADLVRDLGMPTGESPTISTRLGRIDCEMYRVPLRLVSDHGADFPIEASVLLPGEDWTGPTVIGYRGFLEKIRLAIDPGRQGDDGRWIFWDVIG